MCCGITSAKVCGVFFRHFSSRVEIVSLARTGFAKCHRQTDWQTGELADSRMTNSPTERARRSWRSSFLCRAGKFLSANSIAKYWLGNMLLSIHSDGGMDCSFPESRQSGSGPMTCNSLAYGETSIWCKQQSLISLSHDFHSHTPAHAHTCTHAYLIFLRDICSPTNKEPFHCNCPQTFPHFVGVFAPRGRSSKNAIKLRHRGENVVVITAIHQNANTDV